VLILVDPEEHKIMGDAYLGLLSAILQRESDLRESA
jgi:hypothetical protein